MGGIQNTQVLWQAVFLAASPLASDNSVPKLYFARACTTASYAGYYLLVLINKFFLNFLILQIGKHGVPVNSEAVAYTTENGSGKGALQNLLIM